MKDITDFFSGINPLPVLRHRFESLQIHHTDLKYDEKDRLGKGAYGEVYKGTFRDGTEDVAIKFYNNFGKLSDKQLEEFKHEIKVMRKLRSKYLVDIRGYCLDQPYCLVMAFCEQGTLRARLSDEKARISLGEQYNWARQISYGLYHLHSVKIWHRDLKGDNVLLDEHGNAKIADFGLAVIKSSSSGKDEKSDKEMAGTVPWMAPELFIGKPNTEKTDVYSLGVVLWEIISRQQPFRHILPHEIKPVVMAGTRLEVDESWDHVFKEQIRACWNEDPLKRPTAKQVGDAFRQVPKPIRPNWVRCPVKPEISVKWLLFCLLVVIIALFLDKDKFSSLGIFIFSLLKKLISPFPVVESNMQVSISEKSVTFAEKEMKGTVCDSMQALTIWDGRESEDTGDVTLFRFHNLMNSSLENEFVAIPVYEEESDKSIVEEMKRLLPLQNQLVRACELGNVETIESKIELQGAKAYYPDFLGKQPLCAAVWSMNPKAVEYLLGKMGEVATITWSECKSHNLEYYKNTIFLFDQFAPQVFNEWYAALERMDTSSFIYQFHLAIAQKIWAVKGDKTQLNLKWYVNSWANTGFHSGWFADTTIKETELGFKSLRKEIEEDINSKEKSDNAKRVHYAASYYQGIGYENGMGVSKNEKLALMWYKKAAERGSSVAQRKLGFWYGGGTGVTKDEQQAVYWYSKAAAQDDATAQHNLAVYYQNGNGVGQDQKKAFEWYRKAAEQEHAASQYRLASCYQHNIGIIQDHKQAFEWYRRSAEQGYAAAQFSLAEYYQNGGVAGMLRDEKRAVEWYRNAAEQNHAEAQYRLAVCYQYGRGVDKNETQAVQWYLKAVQKNHVEAQYKLAVCYQYGKGIAKNEIKAVELYRKAAERNYPPAQNKLGFCYQYGNGATKDEKQAVEWYRKAAKEKNAEAQFNLGCFYDKGLGGVIVKDDHQAYAWYVQAAEQGHAAAQYNLGCCYDKGAGVDQEEKKAIKWYTEAAKQGYAPAQYNLGLYYDDGMARDEKQAFTWYSKAASQGYSAAQNNLAICYQYGKGTAKSEEQAITWYRAAAMQGYAIAQFNLGYCYDEGIGATKNENLAVEWYRKAAEQGHILAQYNLGFYYEFGERVTKDEKQAVAWYQKAAKKDHAPAQNNLATCYLKGKGVTKDEALAIEWYRKAANQSYIFAQFNLGLCYEYGVGKIIKKDEKKAIEWYKKAKDQGSQEAQTAIERLQKQSSLATNPHSIFGNVAQADNEKIQNTSLTMNITPS